MLCILDERASRECEVSLMSRGFRVLRLPPFRRLGEAVASHPDMLTFYHGGELIASEEYRAENPAIFSEIAHQTNAEQIFTDESFCAEYPYDARLNALVCGNKIFYKRDTVSAAIKEHARAAGLCEVSVKQGYPACTVLTFGNSAITADRGMARVLAAHGTKVTVISDGGISLPPYEYGFIGGCAGVYGNEVYFLGDVRRHAEAKAICAAIEGAGYLPVSLSEEPLRDFGRILFIE